MNPFATGADLQTLDPGLSAELADLVVAMVSDGIRAGVQWPVNEHTAQKIVVPVPGEPIRKVFLKARHVTQASVTVGVRTLEVGDDYTVDKDAGVITLASATTDTVTVSYTAGWPDAEIPGIFRTVTLEWAAVYAANPSNVKSYQMGKTGETFNSDPSSAPVIEDPRLDTYSLGPGF